LFSNKTAIVAVEAARPAMEGGVAVIKGKEVEEAVEIGMSV